MIRLLHAADFHLDSAFSSLSADCAARRRQEQRFALQALSGLCRAHRCDAVLLSGDLFDSARVYRDTLDALRQFFADCGAEVFIAAGNHDHLSPGSPYLTERWPENVHVFPSEKISCFPMERLHLNVYGASFTAPEMPPLLEGFHVSDPQAVNVMVLHGDLQPNSPYNPINGAQISASGLDYLALGHVHAAQSGKAGTAAYGWPGCLMGRGFDECGQKGAFLVELDDGACRTEFLPVRTRRYEILQVEAGSDPLAAVLSALPEDTQEDCYRILLKGESAPIDLSVLERALSPRFFSLSLRDRTLPQTDLWAGCGEDTLRGHFLQELKSKYDEADENTQRILAQAAKLTLALMEGREVTI